MTLVQNPSYFPDEKQSHIFLDGPVGRLEVMTTVPSKPAIGVGVVCHPHPLFEGAMTNKVVHTVAKAFDRKGLKTVRFNFRGVGQSEGSFADGVGETQDLLAVLNWVNKVENQPPLWLAGFSFGAYVATQGAETIAVQQLITIAPVVTKYSFEDLKLEAPWLIIQGTEDELIDASSVKDFAETMKKDRHMKVEYHELAESSHFFHGKLIELRTLIEDHFYQPK